MIGFARRNILIYFRDRVGVFFSLLSVIILIAVYALFLGDTYVDAFENFPDARFLIDSWLMAGVVAVTGVSTAAGAFGILVFDRSDGIDKDLIASPLRPYQFTGGYILCAYVVSCIMCLATFVLAEGYILLGGGTLLHWKQMLQALGILLFGNTAGLSMIFFLASFLRTRTSFTPACTIVGTLIGFLTGMYLPIGMLPNAIQWVVKLFPVSHTASLLREVMLRESIQQISAVFPADALLGFELEMGVRYQFGNLLITPWMSMAYLWACTFLFFGLALLNMKRKKR